MGGRPFSLAAVSVAGAQEEGVEALFTPSEVIGSISASATKIAHGFVERGWDADFGDISIAEKFRDKFGIALISFDWFGGFALGLGRSHEGAGDSELNETPCEDEAGGSRFVANFQILDFLAEGFGEFTESFLDGGIGSSALSVVGGFITGTFESICDGD